MAHKKAGGSTRLGRDSVAKRLGIKKYSGELVKPGDIIIRQRGTLYKAGINVGTGLDHTLYAKTEGKVNFKTKNIKRFTGTLRECKIISVINK